MVNASPSSWTVRGATFAVWLLAAGSCVFWGMKLLASPAPLAAGVSTRATALPDPAAIGRLLGGATPAAVAAVPGMAPAPSRFVLVGIVDAVRSRNGAAVISVDGKPARPFRVGAAIDDTLIVLSVQGRSAVLAPAAGGGEAVTLELPPAKK